MIFFSRVSALYYLYKIHFIILFVVVCYNVALMFYKSKYYRGIIYLNYTYLLINIVSTLSSNITITNWVSFHAGFQNRSLSQERDADDDTVQRGVCIEGMKTFLTKLYSLVQLLGAVVA